MEPKVGSLVVPAPRFREEMKTGEGAAILLAFLRSSALLWYAAGDRSYHVPIRDIREIPDDAVPERSLERTLSGLLLALGAEECQLEEAGPGALRLSLDIPAIDDEGLEALRTRLGASLGRFAIDPGGRQAITLRLELSGLPPAHGAGT